MTSNEKNRLSQARESLHGEDYQAASVTLQGLADEGSAVAQGMLGLLYAQGQGVDQDFEASVALFAAAAAQGDADGQYYLGYSYLEGSGIENDPVTALAWFIQAAARGHGQAIVERDKGFAALDESGRTQANGRSRDLGLPMPAGWLHDQVTGAAFWSPSRYRNGTYDVEIEAPSVDGYAHGKGKVLLTASLPGDPDAVFEGVFANGYLFADKPVDFPVEMLETDDCLIDLSARLPADFPGSKLWARRPLSDARVTLCPRDPGGSVDLLVVVDDDFPAHDDDAVAAIARTAVSLFMELCPLDDNAHATVTTIPVEHGRVYDDGELKFEPRQAETTLSDFGGDPSGWSVTVKNVAADIGTKPLHIEKQRREEAERVEPRRKHEPAAETHAMPDVRGARLGMSLAEFHELFEDEIESWEPGWLAEREMPAFACFEQDIQLKDKARISARFTSAQNNSELFAFGYEQTLRDGPTVESLREDMEAKYGPPDEVDGQGMWMTWWLEGKLGGTSRACLKGRYDVDRETGRVKSVSFGLSDWDFGHRDESMAYDARLQAGREAAAGKIEENTSDTLKF